MESEESIFRFFFFLGTFLDCSTSPFLSEFSHLQTRVFLSLDFPIPSTKPIKTVSPPPIFLFLLGFARLNKHLESRGIWCWLVHKMTQRGEDKGSGSWIGLSSFFLWQLPSRSSRGGGSGNGACIECTTRSHFDIKTRAWEREWVRKCVCVLCEREKEIERKKV